MENEIETYNEKIIREAVDRLAALSERDFEMAHIDADCILLGALWDLGGSRVSIAYQELAENKKFKYA